MSDARRRVGPASTSSGGFAARGPAVAASRSRDGTRSPRLRRAGLAIALLASGAALLAGCVVRSDEGDPTIPRVGGHEPARVEVVVLDSAERPVAAARVDIVDATTARTFGTPAAPGAMPGTFVLPPSGAEGVLLYVRAPAFAPVLARFGRESELVRRLAVQLAPAVSIRGVVVDDRGLPVEGAIVHAEPEWQPELGALRTADGEPPVVSGTRGEFDVTGLGAGRHQIGADHDDAGATGPVRLITAPAEGVVIRLARFGGVRLRLRVPPGGTIPATIASPNATYAWRDGAIEFARVPPGRWSIRLLPDGYAAVSIGADVLPGETTDLGEIPLE